MLRWLAFAAAAVEGVEQHRIREHGARLPVRRVDAVDEIEQRIPARPVGIAPFADRDVSLSAGLVALTPCFIDPATELIAFPERNVALTEVLVAFPEGNVALTEVLIALAEGFVALTEVGVALGGQNRTRWVGINHVRNYRTGCYYGL
jgi:hypothetical protein